MGSEERARFVVRPQLVPKPAVNHLLMTGSDVPIANVAQFMSSDSNLVAVIRAKWRRTMFYWLVLLVISIIWEKTCRELLHHQSKVAIIDDRFIDKSGG